MKKPRYKKRYKNKIKKYNNLRYKKNSDFW